MTRFLSLLALTALLSAAPAPGQFQFNPSGGDAFALPAEPGSEEPDAADLVRFTARLAPAGDGAPAMIEVTATIAEGYHIYSLTQPEGGPQRTVLRLDDASGVRLAGDWVADPAPKTHVDEEAWIGLTIEEHFDAVTWRAPVTLPPGADPASLSVTGVADLQVCTETTCRDIEGAPFAAEVVAAGSIPTVTGASRPAGTASPTEPAAAATPAPAEVDAGVLVSTLLAALVGGLILNLMPCVLPVIGLKVLSFAQQAGHKRGKVLAMNLAYTAGLMSVFMALAALAAFASYGWGELYTHTEFKVAMVALVFAMGLSFLGVWEIPIPGFAGGREANQLQQKEGYSGAFFKGVFTTILATPCSGPFLGSAIGYTLTQPAWVTFLVFGAIGLGMASPYLVIGAFPNLVRSLPKPGAWMETFKQLMGFVLMATVVYLISTVSKDYYLPVLTLLVAIGFACWWVGSTPITASGAKRTTAWVGGFASVAAVGWLAFALLGPSEHGLAWKPFSQAALASAQQRGKPVLVDFTADWCLTCKLNLKRAIDTERVRDVVESNGVTPLLADWTDKSDEIKKTLAHLGSRSIPLLAIYPPGKDEPIVLRDLISEDQLLAALAEAGAVRDNSAATAMPEIEIGVTTPAAPLR